MKSFYRILTLLCLSAIPLGVAADDFNANHIKLTVGESPHQGRKRITSAENRYNSDVILRLVNEYDDNATTLTIKKGQKRQFDMTCNVVFAKPAKSNNLILIARYSTPPIKSKNVTNDSAATQPKNDMAKVNVIKDIVPEIPSEKSDNKEKDGVKEDRKKDKDVNKDKDKKDAKNGKKDNAKDNSPKKDDPVTVPPVKTLSTEKVIADFLAVIDTIPVYSTAQIEEDSVAIMNHIKNLRGWNDKKAYIEEESIETFIQAQQEVIDSCLNQNEALIAAFLKRYEKEQLAEKDACIDSLNNILYDRLESREANLQLLKDEVKAKPKEIDKKVVAVCIASAAILIGLLIWYRIAARKSPKQPKRPTPAPTSSEKASLIVVGQKAIPTLKKQSLDDVYDNEAYMKIECKDFCEDSAVRTMYIKNTCIKDIYNMYAEDLRNPNNPKEDGCMVIGRWVYHEATKEYDVSLEYVVPPGDDAIFAEYELNFGGKIQLKKADMLKRLRRDTGLQYDLTCWVHSHPGLGVFFSNSDNNVQMQLKQELHPHILTALVIDILTPKQETGIFTFKKDSSINSKNDLTKLYSLEEMYKWAVESERRSFNKDDFYNVLGNANKRIFECYGIELNNGAIIDMTYLANNPNGFVGLVHGYPIIQGEKLECITNSVTKTDGVSDSEVIGCFIVTAHCSIPSIRKAIAQYIAKIKFVLVYTATDGLITSIPVVNRELCNSEDYYGEYQLEDLKIWTRRRR